MPDGFFVMQTMSFLERFSFYSVICILVFFLTSIHQLSIIDASIIFGLFFLFHYFSIYWSQFFFKKNKNGLKPLLIVSIIAFLGYLFFFLSINSIETSIISLFLISTGSGIFKNLVKITFSGMFNNPEFASKNQTGFSRYYRIINVTAFVAPIFVSIIINLVFFSKGIIRDDSILFNNETASQYLANYRSVYLNGINNALLLPVIAMFWVILLTIINKEIILRTEFKMIENRVQNLFGETNILLFHFLFAGILYFFIIQQGITHQLIARDLIINDQMKLPPELFLSINPLLILLLQPLVVKLLFFLYNKCGVLTIGFYVRSIYISIILACLILAFGTFNIGSYGKVLYSVSKMNIIWLFGSYFFLSIAEILFLQYHLAPKNFKVFHYDTYSLNKVSFISIAFGSLLMVFVGISFYFINDISVVMLIYASIAVLTLIGLFVILLRQKRIY